MAAEPRRMSIPRSAGDGHHHGFPFRAGASRRLSNGLIVGGATDRPESAGEGLLAEESSASQDAVKAVIAAEIERTLARGTR